jgi:cell division protein FtsL
MPVAAIPLGLRLRSISHGDVRMLVRLACCVALAASVLVPRETRAANCQGEISKLMSKDTEKQTTRYNKNKQIQAKGSNPKLMAEECKIARQLGPRLEDQLAAIKQSGCTKDPQMGNMIADIVRGHEDDLAMARQTTARSDCR